MIAMLLIAQLGAAQIAAPDVQRAPPSNFVSPKVEIIQTLPRATACMGNAGRLEASLAEPAALYRKGDRPAKGPAPLGRLSAGRPLPGGQTLRKVSAC